MSKFEIDMCSIFLDDDDFEKVKWISILIFLWECCWFSDINLRDVRKFFSVGGKLLLSKLEIDFCKVVFDEECVDVKRVCFLFLFCVCRVSSFKLFIILDMIGVVLSFLFFRLECKIYLVVVKIEVCFLVRVKSWSDL